MNRKWLSLITLGLALILAIPSLTGCTSNAPSSTSTMEPGYQLDEFAAFVAKANQYSTSVEIMEWTTGKKTVLTKDSQDFTEILRLLKASTTKQVTNKSANMVENGKTVTVQRTIPYPMGFIMTFDLKDGSKIKFNVTSDNIWFETDEAIYQASVNPDLYSMAKSISVADAISISPSPGSYLTNSENMSSQVLLKDVQIYKGISDRQYISPWYPAGTVNIGESILVLSGSVQNKHLQNKEIAMYAEGYDDTGKQVAWTLDAAHIAGQIGLHLENEETGQFTLHLNLAENIKSIRIFANNYPITPP
jgi:hypothetical protein